MTKDHNLDITQDQRQITLSGNEPGIIIRIKGDGNCLFRAVVESCKYLELSPELIDCFSDHIKLRQTVIEELRKKLPENIQAIKSTISDETEKSVNEITNQDIDDYINKMAITETWAGTSEIQAIAIMLKTRIIIHQDQGNVDIPQGAEYNQWPIAVELVHEAADKSDPNSSTNNNHYNLAMKTNIAEKIISQNQEEQERSRSGSGNSSIHSAQFNMGFSTPLKSKFLGQTIDFDLRKGTQENEVRCVLVFGKDRAPTIVKGAQGRHVSSSALFIEAIKSRTEGLDIEEAIDEVVKLVLEYGQDVSQGIVQFNQFVEQRKERLKSEGVLSQKDREAVYNCEKEQTKQLQALINSVSQISQPELLQNLQEIKKLLEVKQEILSPLENRNKIKKCDLWAHQGCLIDVIKAGVVVLNMMENSAFDGLTQKTRPELAREGGITTGVLNKYRKGNIDDPIDADKIAKDMTRIFDYPVEDIVRRSKDGKKTNQNIVEDFYQAVRRHEKLFYDSFKCIRDLSEDDMLEIRKDFFSKVLDTGWRDKLIELGNKSKDKYFKYSSGLVFKDGCYILKTKFNVNNSTLLEKVIKSGVEISDDEFGYSDEETEAQVKDNQIGGARK
jgi:hypothetical protein